MTWWSIFFIFFTLKPAQKMAWEHDTTNTAPLVISWLNKDHIKHDSLHSFLSKEANKVNKSRSNFFFPVQGCSYDCTGTSMPKKTDLHWLVGSARLTAVFSYLVYTTIRAFQCKRKKSHHCSTTVIREPCTRHPSSKTKFLPFTCQPQDEHPPRPLQGQTNFSPQPTSDTMCGGLVTPQKKVRPHHTEPA